MSYYVNSIDLSMFAVVHKGRHLTCYDICRCHMPHIIFEIDCVNFMTIHQMKRIIEKDHRSSNIVVMRNRIGFPRHKEEKASTSLHRTKNFECTVWMCFFPSQRLKFNEILRMTCFHLYHLVHRMIQLSFGWNLARCFKFGLSPVYTIRCLMWNVFVFESSPNYLVNIYGRQYFSCIVDYSY